MKVKIKECFLNLFIIYILISTVSLTTYLLNFILFDIGTSAFIAFIIVSASIVQIRENFEKKHLVELDKIKTIYSLEYTSLEKIKNISISHDGRGLVLLKNNSILTIEEREIPRTQEELIFR